MRTKNRRKTKNGTRKQSLSKQEINILCKDKTSALEKFEGRFEKGITKNLLKENNIVQQTLVKLLNTPFTPSKITAADDYYSYINYEWILNKSEQLKMDEKNKKDQKFYVQVDSFRLAQEKVYYELIDYTKEYIKSNNKCLSITKIIK